MWVVWIQLTWSEINKDLRRQTLNRLCSDRMASIEEEEEFRRLIEHPMKFYKKETPHIRVAYDQRSRTGLDCAQFKFILSLLEEEEALLRCGPKLPDIGLRLVIIL